MEVKIKNQNELIDATIEMVDGVMVVSPKEVKFDVSQFKDGDVITCGWDETNKSYRWTCILRGDIEYILDNMLISDYCSLDCMGDFIDHNGSSDSATWVRYATEEEKKLLFDKLDENGYKWDAEEKQLVKLKWKPEYKEFYFRITFEHAVIIPHRKYWTDDICDKAYYQKGWCFKTEQECQAFCDRLNKAIENIKP